VAPSKTFVVGFIGKKVYDIYVPRCGRVRLARKNAGVKPRPYYLLRSISIECDKTRHPIGHWARVGVWGSVVGRIVSLACRVFLQLGWSVSGRAHGRGRSKGVSNFSRSNSAWEAGSAEVCLFDVLNWRRFFASTTSSNYGMTLGIDCTAQEPTV
jgi:hypothetical protein